jgi:tetrahydromethanopterin S-methyltransferase subunit G
MFNSIETDSIILPQYVLSLHKIEELKKNLDDINEKLHSERKKRKIK